MELEANTTHGSASYDVSGSMLLSEGGESSISVQVTAQDGVSSTEYTVVVSRAASPSCSLSNLTLVNALGSDAELSPEFSPAILSQLFK